MTAFILRRILVVIPTLLGMTIVIFLMLSVTPGDPAELLLGERATKESLEAMREYLGLKQPLYVQYGMFLKKIWDWLSGKKTFVMCFRRSCPG